MGPILPSQAGGTVSWLVAELGRTEDFGLIFNRLLPFPPKIFWLIPPTFAQFGTVAEEWVLSETEHIFPGRPCGAMPKN